MPILKHGLLWLMLVWTCVCLADSEVPDAEQLHNSITNYHRVHPGLATGGSLNRDSLAELQQHGVTRIIDLRRPPEGTAQEQQWAEALGMQYANLPVGGSLPDDALIEQASVLLDQSQQTATVMHCGSGHRAGVVLALYMHRNGASVEEALEQARAAGTRESAIDALRQRMTEE